MGRGNFPPGWQQLSADERALIDPARRLEMAEYMGRLDWDRGDTSPAPPPDFTPEEQAAYYRGVVSAE